MTILDDIFAHKREEVALRKAAVPLAAVRAAAKAAARPLDFAGALRGTATAGQPAPGMPALIAEVKRRSPSRGLLARDFDAVRLASIYTANGAAAISVLTDERYFGGSLDYLAAIRSALGASCPPLLRKDFICEPYQVYEARAAGADAVLLIVAALPGPLLAELHGLAGELGLAALIEVHDEAELDTALACGPSLVGINNRDLRNFTVDLGTALRLRPLIPRDVVVVAESGIKSAWDLRVLGEARIDAVLVGEGLVTAQDVAARVREFAGLRAAVNTSTGGA